MAQMFLPTPPRARSTIARRGSDFPFFKSEWRARSFVATLLASFALAAPAAAADPPGKAAQPSTPTTPIPKVPIGVSNIVVRLQGDDDIGLASTDVRIHLIEHLRERGFVAVGAESLVFDKDESRRAQFRIGAIVRELECKDVAGRHNCALGVEWQVLDVGRDAVVYKVLTRSVMFGISELKNARVGRGLLTSALDSLLARDGFRGALTMSRAVESDATFPQTTFARCTAITKKMPDAAEQVLQATVVVRTHDGFGSGFFLTSDGLVMTAAHVVPGQKATLRLRSGEEIEAIPIRVATHADVALLRPTRPLTAPSCLAPAAIEPAMGAELYVSGAPAQLELAFSLTRGIVSAIREREGRRVLQTDAPVSPGNSGGPMIDASGAVVAVTSSKFAGGAVEGLGFGIPIAASLAALGLLPAAATDQRLRDAPAVERVLPSEPVVVEDTPDAKTVLDPDGDKRKADEERRRAQTAKREAEVKAQRAREDARDAATPGYLNVFRWGGLALAGAGAITAAVTAANFDAAKTTHPEFNKLLVLNVIGWSAVGIGSAGFLSYFIFRPSLSSARGALPAASVSVGLSGVRLEGAF